MRGSSQAFSCSQVHRVLENVSAARPVAIMCWWHAAQHLIAPLPKSSMACVVDLCNDYAKKLMVLHPPAHGVVRPLRRPSCHVLDMLAVSSVMELSWVDRGKATSLRSLANDAKQVLYDIQLQYCRLPG